MVAPLRTLPRNERTRGNMSRKRILAAGALLWTVTIVDGLAHVVSGDLLAPVLMAILGIVGASWIMMRRGRRGLSQDG